MNAYASGEALLTLSFLAALLAVFHHLFLLGLRHFVAFLGGFGLVLAHSGHLSENPSSPIYAKPKPYGSVYPSYLSSAQASQTCGRKRIGGEQQLSVTASLGQPKQVASDSCPDVGQMLDP